MDQPEKPLLDSQNPGADDNPAEEQKRDPIFGRFSRRSFLALWPMPSPPKPRRRKPRTLFPAPSPSR